MESEKSKNKLDSFIKRTVAVTVKDGQKYEGVLLSYDEHMNILISEVEGPNQKKFKLLILKGGNVSDIALK